MTDRRTTMTRQRKVRQEALRQQLEAGGHVQHVLDMVGKLADAENEIDSGMVERYKVAITTKLKLINKFLPDMKHMEVESDPIQSTSDEELDSIIRELKKRVPERAKATTH